MNNSTANTELELIRFGVKCASSKRAVLRFLDSEEDWTDADISVLVWRRPEGLIRAGEVDLDPNQEPSDVGVGFALRVWADGSHQYHGVVNGRMGWLPIQPAIKGEIK